MTDYWSWWQGGLALGALTVMFRFLLHRPLGVSGSWSRIASSSREYEIERQTQQLMNDRAAMDNAILQATLAEFGQDSLQALKDTEQTQQTVTASNTPPASIGQHAVFLVFIFIGGLLYALVSGRFEPDIELSTRLTELSHGIAPSWIYLLIGGVMVGFGTQMAAGCTSGHGLSGVAQLSRTSIVATVVFFVSAVVTAVFFSMVVSL